MQPIGTLIRRSCSKTAAGDIEPPLGRARNKLLLCLLGLWITLHGAMGQVSAQDGTAKGDQPSGEANGLPSLSSFDMGDVQAWFTDNWWRLAAVFGSVFLAFLVGKIARAVLMHTGTRFRSKGKTVRGAVFHALARSVGFLAVVIGIQVALLWLPLDPGVRAVSQTAMRVLFVVAIALAFYNLVDVVEQFLMRLASRTSSRLDDMLVPLVRASLRVTVVVLTVVQIATILSQKPVTSILAGLGVGGLAIGLAAQDMIKNFFGSVMIFSDRPFEMGDRIQVDGFDGIVETVGFRSTRLRTLDGHIVTIPNGELANDSIRNVSKRPNIKRSFELGVTYDTTPEMLDQALEILHDILRDHEGMDADLPPRIYFTSFADSALVISIIYWYHPADWWKFTEFNQRINREILQRFNEAGIEFAFPTQTIHLVSPDDGTAEVRKSSK